MLQKYDLNQRGKTPQNHYLKNEKLWSNESIPIVKNQNQKQSSNRSPDTKPDLYTYVDETERGIKPSIWWTQSRVWCVHILPSSTWRRWAAQWPTLPPEAKRQGSCGFDFGRLQRRGPPGRRVSLTQATACHDLIGNKARTWTESLNLVLSFM